MTGDRISARLLSRQIIPNVSKALREKLFLRPGQRSIGIVTTDLDDVSYAALDEATKKADVAVVYARSMYAGSANASTALAGEFIGILAAADPAEIDSGLDAFARYLQQDACFYSARADDGILYFAHCISRTGSYLSGQAGVPEGTPMAYLIAPPQEAVCGLDAALKAAPVELKIFYGPPSETNFAGGLLTGEQSACRAACDAFAQEVLRIAGDPLRNGHGI